MSKNKFRKHDHQWKHPQQRKTKRNSLNLEVLAVELDDFGVGEFGQSFRFLQKLELLRRGWLSQNLQRVTHARALKHR